MDQSAVQKARTAEKDDAMAAVWQALNEIGSERRNPDYWERLCLVRALQGIFYGCYSLALTDGRLTRLPQNERSRSYELPFDPITDKANLAFLFKAASLAQDEPVRLMPHLGPIRIV